MAIRATMMPMTTSSSISVNAAGILPRLRAPRSRGDNRVVMRSIGAVLPGCDQDEPVLSPSRPANVRVGQPTIRRGGGGAPVIIHIRRREVAIETITGLVRIE